MEVPNPLVETSPFEFVAALRSLEISMILQFVTEAYLIELGHDTMQKAGRDLVAVPLPILLSEALDPIPFSTPVNLREPSTVDLIGRN